MKGGKPRKRTWAQKRGRERKWSCDGKGERKTDYKKTESNKRNDRGGKGMEKHGDTLSQRLWDMDEGLKMVEMEDSEDGPEGGSQSRGWQQYQSAAVPQAQTHKRTPVDECGVQDMVNLGRIFSSYRHKHIFAPGRCLITLHTANYTLYTAWWVCQCVDVCVHVYMCKWLMVYRYTKCAVMNSGWLAIAVSGLLSTCIWCRDSKKHLYPCTYIYINQFLHTAHDFALLFLYAHVHIVSFYHCTFRNLARLKIRRVLTSF